MDELAAVAMLEDDNQNPAWFEERNIVQAGTTVDEDLILAAEQESALMQYEKVKRQKFRERTSYADVASEDERAESPQKPRKAASIKATKT